MTVENQLFLESDKDTQYLYMYVLLYFPII